MHIKVAKIIKEAVDEAGEDCELRESYSGRGMYGNTTVALVVPGWRVFLPAVAVAAMWIRDGQETLRVKDDGTEEQVERVAENQFLGELSNIRWDHMGRDIVIY